MEVNKSFMKITTFKSLKSETYMIRFLIHSLNKTIRTNLWVLFLDMFGAHQQIDHILEQSHLLINSVSGKCLASSILKTFQEKTIQQDNLLNAWLKTWRWHEKLFIVSNFSFHHIIFNWLLLRTLQKSSESNGLNERKPSYSQRIS